jgi:hypothetical protein
MKQQNYLLLKKTISASNLMIEFLQITDQEIQLFIIKIVNQSMSKLLVSNEEI